MPLGPTHRTAGGLSGLCAAAVRASSRPNEAVVLESIGGCLGGIAGGSLPDILEPATWPGHRSFCHSLLAGGIGLAVAMNTVAQWESFCREHAELARAKMRSDAPTSWDRLLHWIQWILWQIATGLLVGLLAGYSSHLVLDFATPACLPLVA
jgi:hypothetical protein